MKLWEQKAHRLIYELCDIEYREKNPKSRRSSKKHIPYRVPELAEELVDCVKHDKEEEAKYIFLTRF